MGLLKLEVTVGKDKKYKNVPAFYIEKEIKKYTDAKAAYDKEIIAYEVLRKAYDARVDTLETDLKSLKAGTMNVSAIKNDLPARPSVPIPPPAYDGYNIASTGMVIDSGYGRLTGGEIALGAQYDLIKNFGVLGLGKTGDLGYSSILDTKTPTAKCYSRHIAVNVVPKINGKTWTQDLTKEKLTFTWNSTVAAVKELNAPPVIV